jgi:HEPN domain-containing protein
MEKQTQEWFRQSDYDMDTAEYMYQGGRYIYTVFMCHLSIEKALKGLYFEKHRTHPPKTHSLVYLMNKTKIRLPKEKGTFIIKLSEAGIPTRYPENLKKVQAVYTEDVVKELLVKAKEIKEWIKIQL